MHHAAPPRTSYDGGGSSVVASCRLSAIAVLPRQQARCDHHLLLTISQSELGGVASRRIVALEKGLLLVAALAIRLLERRDESFAALLPLGK